MFCFLNSCVSNFPGKMTYKVHIFLIKAVFILNSFAMGQFNLNGLEFPKDFLFGVATSAYQFEGAWNVCGKGENIWDRFTHLDPSPIADGSTGDVACDSYHKYKEDINMTNYIGFDFLRFSLSWSRLFPEGTTDYTNEDGVQFYNNVIDEILDKGIEPLVTIYHWDLPQPLQENLGGWLNSSIVEVFGNYSRAVFKLFGKKVKYWLTINEANVFCTKGYGSKSFAPGIDWHGFGEYICVHNALLAHAKAYHIYDEEFRQEQQGKVSSTVVGTYMMPKNSSLQEDIDAAERANQFMTGWFAHPIFSEEGDYPKIMRELVDRNSEAEGLDQSRLPRFTDEQISEIKGSFDFFGLNYYNTLLAQPGQDGPDPSVIRDSNVNTTYIPGLPVTSCKTQASAFGFRGMLDWVKNQYNNPTVLVTENGLCDIDSLIDQERVIFHEEHMRQMLLAMNEDGCDVRGYTVWSLLDNFEWITGYVRITGQRKHTTLSLEVNHSTITDPVDIINAIGQYHQNISNHNYNPEFLVIKEEAVSQPVVITVDSLNS